MSSLENGVELASVTIAEVDNDQESVGLDRNRRMTFSPMAPDNSPTVLAFDNLEVSVTIRGKRKILLDKISGGISERYKLLSIDHSLFCLIKEALLVDYGQSWVQVEEEKPLC